MCQRAGRGTVLSEEEERYIVEALNYIAKFGYPMDRKDLQHIIKSYIQSVGRETPFKDNVPGHDFLVNFEKNGKKTWQDENLSY